MPLSVEQMRASVRLATGEDEDQLPNDEVDLYLNKSFWHIIEEFPFKEKELRVSFETVAHERNYRLPVLAEAVNHISIVDANGGHQPLEEISITTYEENYDETETYEGFPEKYTRESNFVRLLPTPADVYKINLRYKTTLADIAAGITVPIPQAWHEIIEYGAKWRRLADLKNYADMFANKKIQEDLIAGKKPTHAKEKDNQPSAGLTVLGRRGR